MSDLSVVELAFDLDDLPWIIGPTPQRPFETWLPQAVEVMTTTLGVRRRDKRAKAYVTAVLERVGRPGQGPLITVLLRWLDLREAPLVASFDLVARERPEDVEDFLAAVDSGPVEPAVVEDLAGPPGTTIRRSIAHSRPDGRQFVEARYVVDDGHPDAVVLLLVGERDPAVVTARLEELDAFAATLRVVTRA